MSITYAEYLANDKIQATVNQYGHNTAFSVDAKAGVLFPDGATYKAFAETNVSPIYGGLHDDCIHLSRDDLKALADGAVLLIRVCSEYWVAVYCGDEPE
jgi:hypothetical protein